MRASASSIGLPILRRSVFVSSESAVAFRACAAFSNSCWTRLSWHPDTERSYAGLLCMRLVGTENARPRRFARSSLTKLLSSITEWTVL
jgi:hypothetical protein